MILYGWRQTAHMIPEDAPKTSQVRPVILAAASVVGLALRKMRIPLLISARCR